MANLRFPLPTALHRLIAERDGVAIVEFAFVAPVMLFLLVAVVDLGNAITTSRKVTAAIQTTADLVAQERQLSNAEVDNAFNALDMVLGPFDPDERSAVIYSVVMDPDTGALAVDWSESRGTNPVVPSTADLPPGLLAPGNGIVVVKATYNHKTFLGGLLLPIIGVVGEDRYTMEDEAFLRPRRVPFIPRVN